MHSVHRPNMKKKKIYVIKCNHLIIGRNLAMKQGMKKMNIKSFLLFTLS